MTWHTLSKRNAILLIVLMSFVAPSAMYQAAGTGAPPENPNLPVIVPSHPSREGDVRNPLSFERIHNIVGPSSDGRGLLLDLGDPSYHGTIHTGPYPFEAGEADYDYARYRLSRKLEKGKGVLDVERLVRVDRYNANNWPTDTMTVAYRLDLSRTCEDGHVAHLGFYDSLVSFKRTENGYAPTLTIVEGPFVNLVRSDDPTTVLISWETDRASEGTLLVAGPMVSDNSDKPTFHQAGKSSEGLRHEIRATRLQPDKRYAYYVHSETADGDVSESPVYHFQSAPVRGQGPVTFAFVSDSREGIGGGERNLMGHNARTLHRIAVDAYRRGARFLLFGGDLVNGYTSQPDDFTLQLRGWKQTLAGFWRTRPVYPVIGNHDVLLNVFDDGSRYGIMMDKWPYDSKSTEAVFAGSFWNPTNGPTPSDPRRPTYRENVYSFQHGPVLCIGYNNNYWWTSETYIAQFGGCPEGYIMEDQLAWIETALTRAESDASVKFIILYGQEPIFPCGGHVKDAMWWHGDNNVRAHTHRDGTVTAEGAGMIEVRNRFWKAVAGSSKVAAVLAGDEHAYHRLLIDDRTPVGVFPRDDTNGDGVLDTYSPNADFIHPTWHITAGTAGAPYYSREPTPWEPVKLSSQSGYCLFRADNDAISVTFYSITGQTVDHLADLIAVKRPATQPAKP